MPYRINHEVNVTGTEGLDKLESSQKRVAASSKEVDSTLSLTQKRLSAGLTTGKIDISGAEELLRIMGKLQKFDFTPKAALEQITKGFTDASQEVKNFARYTLQAANAQEAATQRAVANLQRQQQEQKRLNDEQRRFSEQAQLYSNATQRSLFAPQEEKGQTSLFAQGRTPIVPSIPVRNQDLVSPQIARVEAAKRAEAEILRKSEQDAQRISDNINANFEKAKQRVAEVTQQSRTQIYGGPANIPVTPPTTPIPQPSPPPKPVPVQLTEDDRKGIASTRIRELVQLGEVRTKDAASIESSIKSYQRYGVSVDQALSHITSSSSTHSEGVKKLATDIQHTLSTEAAKTVIPIDSTKAVSELDRVRQAIRTAFSTQPADKQGLQNVFLSIIKDSKSAKEALDTLASAETNLGSKGAPLSKSVEQEFGRLQQQQPISTPVTPPRPLYTPPVPIPQISTPLTGELKKAEDAIKKFAANKDLGSYTQRAVTDFQSLISKGTPLVSTFETMARAERQLTGDTKLISAIFKDIGAFAGTATAEVSKFSYIAGTALRAVGLPRAGYGLIDAGRIFQRSGAGKIPLGDKPTDTTTAAGAAASAAESLGVKEAEAVPLVSRLTSALGIQGLIAAGAGAALVAAGAGATALGISAARGIDAQRRLGEEIGLSVQEVQAFQGAADLTGTSFEHLSTALNHFLGGLNDLSGKSNPVLEELKRLRINPRLEGNADAPTGPLKGRLDLLLEINKAERQLDAESSRNSQDILFGRSARSLVNLFRADLESAIHSAEKLNLVYSNIDNSNAIRLAEDTRLIGAAWEGAWKNVKEFSIGVAAIPVRGILAAAEAAKQLREFLKPLREPGEIKPPASVTSKPVDQRTQAQREEDLAGNRNIEQFRQSRENTREGATEQLQVLQNRVQEARRQLQATENTSVSVNPTRTADISKYEKEIVANEKLAESARKRLRAIEAAESVTEQLTEQRDRAVRGELFGEQRINAEYTDKIRHLQQTLQLTEQNKGLVYQTVQAELQHNAILEAEEKLRTRLNTEQVQLRISNRETESTRQDQSRLLRTQRNIASRGENGPEAERVNVLEEFDQSRLSAIHRFTEALSAYRNEITLINTQEQNRTLDPKQARAERARAENQLSEATSTRNIELNHTITALKEQALIIDDQENRLIERRIQLNNENANSLEKALIIIREQVTAAESANKIARLQVFSDDGQVKLPGHDVDIIPQEETLRITEARLQAELAIKRAQDEEARAFQQRGGAVNETERENAEKRIQAARIEGITAAAQLEQRELEARRSAELELGRLRQQQLEDTKQRLGGVVDAAFTFKRDAVTQYFKEQGYSLSKDILKNVIGVGVEKTGGFGTGNLIGNQVRTNPETGNKELTLLGKILEHTPLAVDPRKLAKDPAEATNNLERTVKAANDLELKHTNTLQLNTTAMERLITAVNQDAAVRAGISRQQDNLIQSTVPEKPIYPDTTEQIDRSRLPEPVTNPTERLLSPSQLPANAGPIPTVGVEGVLEGHSLPTRTLGDFAGESPIAPTDIQSLSQSLKGLEGQFRKNPFPSNIFTDKPITRDITPGIDVREFAQAIAQQEGFYKAGTLAERNNNPGNLRPSSPDQPVDTTGNFRKFDSIDQGFAALEKQIRLNSSRDLTLKEFFAGKPGVYPGYASSKDNNDPNQYASTVANKLGVDPDKKIVLRTEVTTPKIPDISDKQFTIQGIPKLPSIPNPKDQTLTVSSTHIPADIPVPEDRKYTVTGSHQPPTIPPVLDKQYSVIPNITSPSIPQPEDKRFTITGEHNIAPIPTFTDKSFSITGTHLPTPIPEPSDKQYNIKGNVQLPEIPPIPDRTFKVTGINEPAKSVNEPITERPLFAANTVNTANTDPISIASVVKVVTAEMGLSSPTAFSRITRTPIYNYNSPNAAEAAATLNNKIYVNGPLTAPTAETNIRHETVHAAIEPVADQLSTSKELIPYLDKIQKGLTNLAPGLYQNDTPSKLVSEGLAYGSGGNIPGLTKAEMSDFVTKALRELHDEQPDIESKVRRIYATNTITPSPVTTPTPTTPVSTSTSQGVYGVIQAAIAPLRSSSTLFASSTSRNIEGTAAIASNLSKLIPLLSGRNKGVEGVKEGHALPTRDNGDFGGETNNPISITVPRVSVVQDSLKIDQAGHIGDVTLRNSAVPVYVTNPSTQPTEAPLRAPSTSSQIKDIIGTVIGAAGAASSIGGGSGPSFGADSSITFGDIVPESVKSQASILPGESAGIPVNIASVAGIPTNSLPDINSLPLGGKPQGGLPLTGPFTLGGGSTTASNSALGSLLGGLKNTGDIRGIFTGIGTGPGGVGAQSLSGLERIGAGIGTGLAVYQGVRGIESGIKRGGVGGISSAVGSGLATAAAFDPEPISKAALLIGAAVAKTVSAIAGDPRANRDREIQRDVAQRVYTEKPSPITETSDVRGRNVTRLETGMLESVADNVIKYTRDQADVVWRRGHGFDPNASQMISSFASIPMENTTPTPTPGIGVNIPTFNLPTPGINTTPSQPAQINIHVGGMNITAWDGKSVMDAAPQIANVVAHALSSQSNPNLRQAIKNISQFGR